MKSLFFGHDEWRREDMSKKTASKPPVLGPPASDGGSDAVLSHPTVASGLAPDENLMFPRGLSGSQAHAPASQRQLYGPRRGFQQFVGDALAEQEVLAVGIPQAARARILEETAIGRDLRAPHGADNNPVI